MKYKITYLACSKYCEETPQDTVCHKELEVEADNKGEAVMTLHKETGYILEENKTKNILPIVWEIEEVL